MDKREKNKSPVINFNIQVNINSQNPVQDISSNKKTVTTEQKKSSIRTWIGKMFKALVEFFSSIDSNNIIMLIAMMIGMWL